MMKRNCFDFPGSICPDGPEYCKIMGCIYDRKEWTFDSKDKLEKFCADIGAIAEKKNQRVDFEVIDFLNGNYEIIFIHITPKQNESARTN